MNPSIILLSLASALLGAVVATAKVAGAVDVANRRYVEVVTESPSNWQEENLVLFGHCQALGMDLAYDGVSRLCVPRGDA